MKWAKHRVEGERGPLAVWWSRGNAEIVPVCTATLPRLEVRFEVVVAGRAVALVGSAAAARKAAP